MNSLDNKKNLYILTFHCAHNYGAVLQTYATLNFLKEYGYEVKVLDYRPDFLTKPFKIFRLKYYLARSPKLFFHRITTEPLNLKHRFQFYRNFRLFIEEKLQTVPINKIKPDSYIIIGSDQVWTKSLNNGKFDTTYLGDLPYGKGLKLISYAASIGNCKFSDSDWNLFGIKLKKFKNISIRENSLKNTLQEKLSIDASVVCDPTFLLEAKDWNKLERESKIRIKGEYIVVYEVVEDNSVKNFADKLSRFLNCNVIHLCSNITYRNDGRNYIQNASPADFISLIKNARFIVTTSFHGTAFSIIYRKDFYTISLSEGIDDRAKSLLTRLGLEDRLVKANEINPSNFNNVEYSEAEIKLNEFRNYSINFLFNSINDN